MKGSAYLFYIHRKLTFISHPQITFPFSKINRFVSYLFSHYCNFHQKLDTFYAGYLSFLLHLFHTMKKIYLFFLLPYFHLPLFHTIQLKVRLCLLVCSLPLTLLVNISDSGWYIFLRSFGDIEGILVHPFYDSKTSEALISITPNNATSNLFL